MRAFSGVKRSFNFHADYLSGVTAMVYGGLVGWMDFVIVFESSYGIRKNG